MDFYLMSGLLHQVKGDFTMSIRFNWCLGGISRHHRSLLAWTSRVYTPSSAAGSPRFASHREASSFKERRRRGESNPHGVTQQPAGGAGKSRRHEDPRERNQSRLSSELRKLSLEDFPEERERRWSETSSGGEGHEIVFGIAPCLLALRTGRRKAQKLFVKDDDSSQRESLQRVCQEARARGVPVERVGKKDLDRMSPGRVHQGACLRASPLTFLPDDPSPDTHPAPLWLVLEGIQDPMNLGAILRSAYFLGVDRVVSGLRRSCPLTPAVSKASSGVMEVMGVYGYEDLEGLLRGRAERGWRLVGTVGSEAPESPLPVGRCSDFRMSGPTMLLVGGEGEGLSGTLLSLCRTLITIPPGRDLVPGVESLNVSVATAILLQALLSGRPSGR